MKVEKNDDTSVIITEVVDGVDVVATHKLKDIRDIKALFTARKDALLNEPDFDGKQGKMDDIAVFERKWGFVGKEAEKLGVKDK